MGITAAIETVGSALLGDAGAAAAGAGIADAGAAAVGAGLSDAAAGFAAGTLTAGDALAAGASVSDLVAAGATASDLVAAGAPVADLVAAGVPATDLAAAGVPATDLAAVGAIPTPTPLAADTSSNLLTQGTNLGGSTLGAGQASTPLSALNDGTLGSGLTGTGTGLGLSTTGDVASVAGLGGQTAADVGGNSLGQLGLTGSGATLGSASSGAVNGLGGGGSVLSSLLPSNPLGTASLLNSAAGVGSALIGANASQNAANTQSQAGQNAIALQQQMFNTQNAQLAPNRAAGYNALNQLQGNLAGPYTQYDANGNPIGQAQGTGYFTNQMTPSDLTNYLSPYYQFGLNQGLGQASNISNATGGKLSGNTLQGLNQYAQDYAQSGAEQSFNNYQNQRTNIYNTLAGIAGLGQQAQNTTANLASNTAQTQSNLGVGSAAAQAAGQIGQAGAYTGALNNIGSNYMLSSLLNPSSASNYIAPSGGYASTLGSLNLG